MIALAAWLLWLCGDAMLRFGFLIVVPFLWVKSAFGAAHTQTTIQAEASLGDFLTRPFLRMPRADWRSLVGNRRSGPPKDARSVKKIRNGRV